MRTTALAVLGLALGSACGGGNESDAAPDGGAPVVVVPASRDEARDVLDTDLKVDVEADTAVATIHLAPSPTSQGASFEIGDLRITSVSNARGSLAFAVDGKRLDVGVPVDTAPTEVRIAYKIARHTQLEGLLPGNSTYTWPYFCGNLFPCRSTPSDGVKLTMNLSNLPVGTTAVYPAAVSADAPSYMLAWAVGDYGYLDLGSTPSGTAVGAYYFRADPAAVGDAGKGTAHLKDVFAWYESNLGPYTFGKKVASVAVDWGAGAYGGMEHHPFWHLAVGGMSVEENHAHEAAHGWFGNGVRIACWEEMVLSEGTVSYLTTRSLGATAGTTVETMLWGSYQRRLDAVMKRPEVRKVAWPDSCGTVDGITMLNDIPYMKGAFFFRALEQKVGRPALDLALKNFYAARIGSAARMTDLLEVVKKDAGYDASACAASWLRADAVPTSTACP